MKAFEMLHLHTYQNDFISAYSKSALIVDTQLALAQQSQREVSSYHTQTTQFWKFHFWFFSTYLKRLVRLNIELEIMLEMNNIYVIKCACPFLARIFKYICRKYSLISFLVYFFIFLDLLQLRLEYYHQIDLEPVSKLQTELQISAGNHNNIFALSKWHSLNYISANYLHVNNYT